MKKLIYGMSNQTVVVPWMKIFVIISTVLTISTQNKSHSCSYCDKPSAKIDQHYEHHHKGKAEVAEGFAYHEAQKILKKALEKL